MALSFEGSDTTTHLPGRISLLQSAIALRYPSLRLPEPTHRVVGLRFPILPTGEVLLKQHPRPSVLMVGQQHMRVQIIKIGHGLHRAERRLRRGQQASLEWQTLGNRRRGVWGPAAFQKALRFPVHRRQPLDRIRIPGFFGGIDLRLFRPAWRCGAASEEQQGGGDAGYRWKKRRFPGHGDIKFAAAGASGLDPVPRPAAPQRAPGPEVA